MEQSKSKRLKIVGAVLGVLFLTAFSFDLGKKVATPSQTVESGAVLPSSQNKESDYVSPAPEISKEPTVVEVKIASPTPKPSPVITPALVTPTPTPQPTSVTQPSQPSQASQADYYINVDGNKVQSPTFSDSVPAGATAQCNDGSYSFSQNHRGTCSGHGGVGRWL